MASWGDPKTGDATAELRKLAEAIDREKFIVTLATGQEGQGRPPHLCVLSRASSLLAENVYCDGANFYWGWGKDIAPVAEVATAAEKVAQVLATGRGAH